MNTGGISFLRISRQSTDKTSTNPVTVGIAPDGSAYAGSAGAVTKVPIFNINLEPSEMQKSTFLHNSRWTNVGLHLNLEEMQQRITDKKGNLRHAESWSPLLDQAIRSGIRKAGCQHLLKNFSVWEKIFAFTININNGLLDAADISFQHFLSGSNPKLPTVESLISSYVFNFVLWTIIETATNGIENRSGSGYRISMLPGFEIDRAAVLQVWSRRTKLVASVRESGSGY
jgi:hypothetical protein